MIKTVMDLLAWKNSLVITEETQVRKKGGCMKEGTEQKLLEWDELYAPLFSAFYTSTYRF